MLDALNKKTNRKLIVNEGEGASGDRAADSYAPKKGLRKQNEIEVVHKQGTPTDPLLWSLPWCQSLSLRRMWQWILTLNKRFMDDFVRCFTW